MIKVWKNTSFIFSYRIPAGGTGWRQNNKPRNRDFWFFYNHHVGVLWVFWWYHSTFLDCSKTLRDLSWHKTTTVDRDRTPARWMGGQKNRARNWEFCLFFLLYLQVFGKILNISKIFGSFIHFRRMIQKCVQSLQIISKWWLIIILMWFGDIRCGFGSFYETWFLTILLILISCRDSPPPARPIIVFLPPFCRHRMNEHVKYNNTAIPFQ